MLKKCLLVTVSVGCGVHGLTAYNTNRTIDAIRNNAYVKVSPLYIVPVMIAGIQHNNHQVLEDYPNYKNILDIVVEHGSLEYIEKYRLAHEIPNTTIYLTAALLDREDVFF